MAEQKIEQTGEYPVFTSTVVRSPQFRAVYVDHATGGFTNWDLRFTFGLLTEHEPGRPAVEQQVMLVMTYEFAKAMVGTLSTAVQAYERKPSPEATLSAELSAASAQKKN